MKSLYKEIMLKDRCKHIPEKNTPYLCSWYFRTDKTDICFQVKRKTELHNGIVLNRQDAKRLVVFLTEFLRGD
jgi:hypothetical protein